MKLMSENVRRSVGDLEALENKLKKEMEKELQKGLKANGRDEAKRRASSAMMTEDQLQRLAFCAWMEAVKEAKKDLVGSELRRIEDKLNVHHTQIEKLSAGLKAYGGSMAKTRASSALLTDDQLQRKAFSAWTEAMKDTQQDRTRAAIVRMEDKLKMQHDLVEKLGKDLQKGLKANGQALAKTRASALLTDEQVQRKAFSAWTEAMKDTLQDRTRSALRKMEDKLKMQNTLIENETSKLLSTND